VEQTISAWQQYANLGGLILNLMGFVLIARELRLHPDDRIFLSGGDKSYRADYCGFVLVVTGTLVQVAGQIPVSLLKFIGRGSF
jgi:hypothetical protein